MESPEVPEVAPAPSPAKPKRKFPILIVLIIVAVLALAAGAVYYWYTTNGPCGTKLVASATQELGDLHDDFKDYREIASSTGRIALTGPVTELQNIKKETQSLVVPACLVQAQTLLVNSMDADITGFLFFMAQEKDELILLKMDAAADWRTQFYEEIVRINECAPFCK